MWWIAGGILIITLVVVIWIFQDPLGRDTSHAGHGQGDPCGPGCMSVRDRRFLDRMNRR